MATPDKVEAIYNLFIANHNPYVKFNPIQLKLWKKGLDDYSDDVLERAAFWWIYKSNTTRFPLTGDIINTCARMVLEEDGYVDKHGAWKVVESEILNKGYSRAPEFKNITHSVVKLWVLQIIKEFGGWREVCMMDSGILRNMFKKRYAELYEGELIS